MPMFGVPNRSNLITMFLNAAITQKPLALSKEEFRGITYVREVAEQTLQAVNLPVARITSAVRQTSPCTRLRSCL